MIDAQTELNQNHPKFSLMAGLRSALAHWDLGLLVVMMGMMLAMTVFLLWPQPQAQIVLKPLAADSLMAVSGPSASETITREETVSENDETAPAKPRTKRKKAHHASYKKSKHPPVLNLNRASLSQFQLLPGIGPKTAERILEYRKAHGAFATPEQIMDVKGIGPKKFEKLKPFLKV